MLRVDWIKNPSVKDDLPGIGILYEIMVKTPYEELFSSAFCKTITQKYQDNFRDIVMMFVVAPYFVYFVCAITYLTFVVNENVEPFKYNEQPIKFILEKFFRYDIYIFMMYLASIEFIQFLRTGCRYFLSLYNILEIS